MKLKYQMRKVRTVFVTYANVHTALVNVHAALVNVRVVPAIVVVVEAIAGADHKITHVAYASRSVFLLWEREKIFSCSSLYCLLREIKMLLDISTPGCGKSFIDVDMKLVLRVLV
jgi:hypothetical protein